MRRRRMLAASSWLLALVGLLAWTGPALAYSDIERFAAAPSTGGGGGRYFTGSPIDGYGCNVCHQGGAEPKVEVKGLPEGYTPGRLYEIEVIWENNPAVPVALQLEFVGRDGRAAGQAVLLKNEQLDERQACTSGDREPADYNVFPEGRKVLGVQACGAQHMRFRFGPPDTPDVSFTMSLVTSDKSGSADGDGVFNMRRILRRSGEPAPSTGNCSLAAPSGAHLGQLAACSAVLALLWRRRSRFR